MPKTQENETGLRQEAKKIRKKVYSTSYLTHKQSLNFTLDEFDWLHIRRLNAFRKEEFERKRKKRDDRLRLGLYDFLQNSSVDKEHPLYCDLISSDGDTSDSEPSSTPVESEEMILKRLVAIRRKEYCLICDGLCRLFQRRSQRYYDYQNRHFLRSLRALRRESAVGWFRIDKIITKEDLNRLYGRTLHALAFLRSYKIPKIKNQNTPPEDFYYSSTSEDLECDLIMDDCSSFTRNTFHRKKEDISRPKRDSKFNYRDKFNSSDEEEGSDDDASSATDSGCSVSELSGKLQNYIRNTIDDNSQENSLELQKATASITLTVISDTNEDILSLFPEDEEIRLPKQGRHIKI